MLGSSDLYYTLIMVVSLKPYSVNLPNYRKKEGYEVYVMVKELKFDFWTYCHLYYMHLQNTTKKIYTFKVA